MMGLLKPYSNFLLNHPGKVLLGGTCSVLLLFGFTLFLHPLQSFNDPLVGFEARGTLISTRLNTWKLLTDESSALTNNISLLPYLSHSDGGYSFKFGTSLQTNAQSNNISQNETEIEPEPPLIESSIEKVDNISGTSEELDEDEAEYYRMVNSSRKDITTSTLVHYSLGSSKAFCGKLYEGYAQAVVTPATMYSYHGLFNLNSMLATCHLDAKLRLEQSRDERHIFASVCEQYRMDETNELLNTEATTCCNSWSLPNYIACLNNKTSCMEIDIADVRRFEHSLDMCAPYYLKTPYEECFVGTYKDSSIQTAPMASFIDPQSGKRIQCGAIPDECIKCDGWTFTVLHYLTSESFIKSKSHPPHVSPPEITSNRIRHPARLMTLLGTRETSAYKLTHTNIFLPVAKSSSLMKYYQALSKYSLKSPHAQVKVLNLGLKNSLFELMISDDVKLFTIALASILVVISIYTWSFILSLVILLIIILSLCLSYTIYELLLAIAIFPFMNLLAVVISFGICSDNAMLFCKHWSSGQAIPDEEGMADGVPQEEAVDSVDNEGAQPSAINVSTGNGCHAEQINDVCCTPPESYSREYLCLDRMLKRAIMSTSAATLATACSFIISAISRVTAVRCFCIFATLSVITNYILIVLLLPPALILDSKLKNNLQQVFSDKTHKLTRLSHSAQSVREHVLQLGDILHRKWIFTLITKFKFYLIISFVTLMICASIMVFHGPTLQPADDDDIHLLSKHHAFEQYDKNLRKQFAFERAKETVAAAGNTLQIINSLQEPPETLPIRVVFGVLPADNGDPYDPQDRGTLVFDRNFDIAEPKTQIWLSEFCRRLEEQKFVMRPAYSDMSRCFMYSFRTWMESRSCIDPINPSIDRTPCCQTSEFPFERYVFNKCMLEAVDIVRQSPSISFNINSGLRFFKNSTRVAAMLVEYQSNRIYTDSFTKMDRFFNDIDDWVSWQLNNNAPPSLRSGWFISSNLELLALQTELENSTNISVWLEVLFAMIALMFSTRDFCLTLAGTLTISTIIIVILAALILLKWTLGVAESILISLTIGLSVDFALHYTVAYGEGLRSRLSHGVVERILNEVGSPIALASITTSLAGFIIFWSDILAYQELGTFLMLIAIISWLTSTFFLLPMLATFDLIRKYGERCVRLVVWRAMKVLIDRM